MKNKLILTLAGSALAIVALAGCSSTPATSGSSDSGSSDSAPSTSSSDTATVSGDLAVASTGLGDIVVDGKGMTAYYFDNDTANSGTSACTGGCASMWPAITATSDKPTVTGVTGTVATITGTAGGKQITINGRPIYTYVGDTKAGDTAGQGIGGIWYVISANGDEMKTSGTKSGY